MAYLSGYTQRKKITIDHTKIGETLTDFPLLVKLTSANFDFSESNADGFDIRFTSGDGTTLLKYERERHDSANSLAEYWVKVPSVSSTTDTIIYLYHRTTDTADGADPANVWDSGFAMVHHMNDATTSTILDSTSNNNDGTKTSANHPIEADAKIGKGQTFTTANSDKIDMGDSVVSAAGGFTQEAVVYLTGSSGTHSIFSRHLDYSIFPMYPATPAIYFYLKDSGGTLHSMKAATCPQNEWLHIVETYDGTKMRIYVNGQVYNGENDAFTVNSANDAHGIGYRIHNATQYFGGQIDEVRISNCYRAPEWVLATYYSNFNTLVTYTSDDISASPSPSTSPSTSVSISPSVSPSSSISASVSPSVSESTSESVSPSSSESVSPSMSESESESASPSLSPSISPSTSPSSSISASVSPSISPSTSPSSSISASTSPSISPSTSASTSPSVSESSSISASTSPSVSPSVSISASSSPSISESVSESISSSISSSESPSTSPSPSIAPPNNVYIKVNGSWKEVDNLTIYLL